MAASYPNEQNNPAAAIPVYLSTPTGTPPGAVAVRGAATVANAIASASLGAVAGVTNYMTGFEVTGLGATSAAGVQVVVSGTQGGGLLYTIAVPAGVLVGIQPLIVQFNPPLPAFAANTPITVTVPAFGAGNTAVTANVRGFQV